MKKINDPEQQQVAQPLLVLKETATCWVMKGMVWALGPRRETSRNLIWFCRRPSVDTIDFLHTLHLLGTEQLMKCSSAMVPAPLHIAIAARLRLNCGGGLDYQSLISAWLRMPHEAGRRMVEDATM